MNRLMNYSYLAGMLAAIAMPAFATVSIVSLHPSVKSPQILGTPVIWEAIVTDTGTGQPTFQFSVAAPGGQFKIVKDYNVGTKSSGMWRSQPFVWVPNTMEGVYRIQVAIMNFTSSETATKMTEFQVKPLVTGTMPVVAPTSHPLVFLFSSPPCITGSKMRVSFQPQDASVSATATNWLPCNPPHTLTFQLGGMYPSTIYQAFAETETGGTVTNGPTLTFTTGRIPSGVPVPSFTVVQAAGPDTDTADGIVLHGLTQLGAGVRYAKTATDLNGKVNWYYFLPGATRLDVMTRPLPGGQFIIIEDGATWTPGIVQGQLLHQVDLTGNIVRETNIGLIQHQLVAMGVTDAGPCNTIPKPPAIGSACMGAFHHDAIVSLPNGYSAAIADIEKIFPAGTQGDTSTLPVDIIGDIIIVMDENWQVVWYFDTFQHDGGHGELDITRAAVLGETCGVGQGGCPPIQLLGTGIAPRAHDWLHMNSLYYWPAPQDGNTVGGDIVWSSRHQDWVMKVDYRDMQGTGNILWRMGVDGDFKFNNIGKSAYPWFSHQHEVGIENGGAGPMSIFDNGNTRIGKNHGKGDSRGMAIMIDEAAKEVTPLLSQDLGVYSIALGSAQLLADGNYFFAPGLVVVSPNVEASYTQEYFPTPGMLTGTDVLNIMGPEAYRAWQVPDLYTPPTT